MFYTNHLASSYDVEESLGDEPTAHMQSVGPTVLERSFASHLFGDDIFFSYAHGPPSRDAQKLRIDLARRLREHGVIVSFSKDKAPLSGHLDLRQARLVTGLMGGWQLAWVRQII